MNLNKLSAASALVGGTNMTDNAGTNIYKRFSSNCDYEEGALMYASKDYDLALTVNTHVRNRMNQCTRFVVKSVCPPYYDNGRMSIIPVNTGTYTFDDSNDEAGNRFSEILPDTRSTKVKVEVSDKLTRMIPFLDGLDGIEWDCVWNTRLCGDNETVFLIHPDLNCDDEDKADLVREHVFMYNEYLRDLYPDNMSWDYPTDGMDLSLIRGGVTIVDVTPVGKYYIQITDKLLIFMGNRFDISIYPEYGIVPVNYGVTCKTGNNFRGCICEPTFLLLNNGGNSMCFAYGKIREDMNTFGYSIYDCNPGYDRRFIGDAIGIIPTLEKAGILTCQNVFSDIIKEEAVRRTTVTKRELPYGEVIIRQCSFNDDVDTDIVNHIIEGCLRISGIKDISLITTETHYQINVRHATGCQRMLLIHHLPNVGEFCIDTAINHLIAWFDAESITLPGFDRCKVIDEYTRESDYLLYERRAPFSMDDFLYLAQLCNFPTSAFTINSLFYGIVGNKEVCTMQKYGVRILDSSRNESTVCAFFTNPNVRLSYDMMMDIRNLLHENCALLCSDEYILVCTEKVIFKIKADSNKYSNLSLALVYYKTNYQQNSRY